LAGQFGPSLTDNVPKPCCVYWPEVKLPKLRPNQIEALEAWSEADCRGQIIMPTGTGKTEVALAAMARAKIASLIVAPVRDLMYQ
jgi:superfamily II DNA or RNA helicase